MQNKFQEFIEKNKLFSSSEKILLTVSGGIDSVTMAVLFQRAGYKFGIAHCNFGLRGEESDNDQKFVKKIASQMDVPFFTVNFHTLEYAKKEKISIQMAARQLRYEWFEKIRQQEGFQYIATAHHLDDQTETFFINLIRGTGITGLHGILPKKDKIIRPLLCFYRSEIEKFITENNISFRNDSSNDEDHYLRNRLRHHILPELQQMKPGAKEAINQTIFYLRKVEVIYKDIIEKEIYKISINKNDYIVINKNDLLLFSSPEILLGELLVQYGFTKQISKEIYVALNGQPGKQFFSATHRLVCDRDTLIVTKNKEKQEDKWEILKGKSFIELPIHLKLELLDNIQKVKFKADHRIAYFDYDKLIFPLQLRKWKQGDFFYPFGMKGKKKISDYFIDNKIPLPEKENILLLISDNQVIWVVGYRSDNRFKVGKTTNKILQISMM